MADFVANATGVREPRRRRYVSPRMIRLLRILGFRYSFSRDAYVLRLVGARLGPVVRPLPPSPADAGEAPAPRTPQAIDSWNQPTVSADDAGSTRRADREYERS
jgi:hypothetical protein